MTTGAPMVVRAWMKPLPTLTKPLRSVDIATHEPAEALRERTDSCTVPAAGVVGEAMVAFVLADAYRLKFGGDHIEDVRAALRAYKERIGWRDVGHICGLSREGAMFVGLFPVSSVTGIALIGFMGSGKTTAAAGAPPRAPRRSTSIQSSSALSAARSSASSTRRGRRCSAPGRRS